MLSLGVRRIIDVGCGEGRLLKLLLAKKSLSEIAGMDVSHHALEKAQKYLHLDQLPPMQKEKITLFQGSLLYRDKRIAGYDAATVVEVIEHLDNAKLPCPCGR